MWNQHWYDFFEHQMKKDHTSGEDVDYGWARESDFLGMHSQ
jgi:hypothetical protein